jgi:hypothetical protein
MGQPSTACAGPGNAHRGSTSHIARARACSIAAYRSISRPGSPTVAKAAPPGVRRRLLRVFVRRGLLDVLSRARGKEGTEVAPFVRTGFLVS